MSTTTIANLTFLATTLLIYGIATMTHSGFFGYRGRLNLRLGILNADGDTATDGSLFKQNSTLGNEGPTSRWAQLDAYFTHAHFRVRFQTYVQIVLAAATVLGATVAAVSGRWCTAPLAFSTVVFLGGMLVFIRRRRRTRALIAQLPGALDVIGRAVRAGQTVSAAFQIVADDLESPIADEFRLCYEEQQFGIPHEASLRNLAARTGMMELQIFVVAMLVHTRSGGNMIELLDNLSQMVQRRLRLEQRTQALTSEGRMQAAVLIALPTVAFGLLLIVAPSYVATLLAYPKLLQASFVAQLLGAVWIRRCIHFDY